MECDEARESVAEPEMKGKKRREVGLNWGWKKTPPLSCIQKTTSVPKMAAVTPFPPSRIRCH